MKRKKLPPPHRAPLVPIYFPSPVTSAIPSIHTGIQKNDITTTGEGPVPGTAAPPPVTGIPARHTPAQTAQLAEPGEQRRRKRWSRLNPPCGLTDGILAEGKQILHNKGVSVFYAPVLSHRLPAHYGLLFSGNFLLVRKGQSFRTCPQQSLP